MASTSSFVSVTNKPRGGNIVGSLLKVLARSAGKAATKTGALKTAARVVGGRQVAKHAARIAANPTTGRAVNAGFKGLKAAGKARKAIGSTASKARSALSKVSAKSVAKKVGKAGLMATIPIAAQYGLSQLSAKDVPAVAADAGMNMVSDRMAGRSVNPRSAISNAITRRGEAKKKKKKYSGKELLALKRSRRNAGVRHKTTRYRPQFGGGAKKRGKKKRRGSGKKKRSGGKKKKKRGVQAMNVAASRARLMRMRDVFD